MVSVVTGPLSWFLHTNNTVFTAFLVKLENMHFSGLWLHPAYAVQVSWYVMYMLADIQEINLGFTEEFL